MTKAVPMDKKQTKKVALMIATDEIKCIRKYKDIKGKIDLAIVLDREYAKKIIQEFSIRLNEG